MLPLQNAQTRPHLCDYSSRFSSDLPLDSLFMCQLIRFSVLVIMMESGSLWIRDPNIQLSTALQWTVIQHTILSLCGGKYQANKIPVFLSCRCMNPSAIVLPKLKIKCDGFCSNGFEACARYTSGSLLSNSESYLPVSSYQMASHWIFSRVVPTF